MPEHVLPLITLWESFFVIIGTAAATLLGLMFIVITLNTGLQNQSGVSNAQAAFNTPNVVHFCVALFIAVLFGAPWTNLMVPALLLGIIGIGGTLYIALILRRFRHLSNYKPVLEDWMWHIIIPFACYITLFIAAILLVVFPASVMFFIGAVTVVYLYIGIHNSWDTVTYLVTATPRDNNNNPPSV